MQVSGVPWGGEHGHGRSNPTVMGIVHNSYGQYPGDAATVAANGSAHFVIGKNENEWIQLADTDSVTWNCGNWTANNCSVAIEFTGTSEEDLTDWQTRAGAHIIKEVSAYYVIPMNYDDGSNGPVDTAPFNGWYSHRAIRPDAGSQHTDFISIPEWNLMVGTSGVTGTTQPSGSKGHDMIIVEERGTGKWYIINDDGGKAECGAGVAYVYGISGVPVLRDQDPLAIVGQQLILGRAAKDARALAAKV